MNTMNLERTIEWSPRLPAQQQQQPPQQQQQQQMQQKQQPATGGEPEMCTTCPNCQTTIYLVRGDMSPRGDGATVGEPAQGAAAN